MAPLLLGLAAVSLAARPPSSDGEAARAPVVLELPVRRDTVVSAAKNERNANLGGSRRLKTKGIVELTLFDVSVERLQGAILSDPVLHIRAASEDFQRRVTVSSIAAEWVEGRSDGYRPEPGAASFDWAEQGERRWAYPESDVTAVINGRGHTLWSFADPMPPDPRGWQKIALDPRVLAARVAGLSGGFALTDDVGSEYDRKDDEFLYHIFPNRFLYSREQGDGSTPYLTVGVAGADHEPPGSVHVTPAEPGELANLPPGESLVRIRTPADRGRAGTLGFEVRFTEEPPFEWATAEPVPRYLIPFAAAEGERVEVRLRDLELAPGRSIEVGARAVDGAGNRGPVSFATVPVSGGPSPLEMVSLAEAAGRDSAERGSGEVLRLGDRAVFVADPLDKMHPETGEMIPPRPPSYRVENHIWSARERRVRLAAARNEFVAFQVIASAGAGRLELELGFDGSEGCQPSSELLRFVSIPSEAGPLPDPLVPLAAALDPAIEAATGVDPRVTSRARSFLVDLYVPHDCVPGVHRGRLSLSSGGQVVEIGVELEVWSFTLPDHLSFIPQMNSYGLPPPPADLGYYRLAHRHRTCLNMVPYSWRGDVFRGYKPASGAARWRQWDARFGPLLDGSAFHDLPRAGVPVDAFYLPLNESWPTPVDEGFGGGYWAERALSASYRERFVEGAALFAEHFSERGWNDTFFEFYLNNKLYHRRQGWGRSSAYWVFDEPINTQDFWALRWYGVAFHEGVARALGVDRNGGPKLAFRADISRPEWQRNLLDGVLDVNVVGLGFAPYLRAVLDRRDRFGEVLYNYGTSNRVERSNVQPAAWAIWAWSVGADGVLPWKTVGKESSWRKASPLALFYPGLSGEAGPHPSVRLKAYRRGQQDVEYLTMLAAATGHPRWSLGERVIAELDLQAALSGGGSDAGRLDFESTDPVDLWKLRVRVGATLDRLAPPARRRWVELRSPPRDPASLGGPAILTTPSDSGAERR
jgi:hypothetical protein